VDVQGRCARRVGPRERFSAYSLAWLSQVERVEKRPPSQQVEHWSIGRTIISGA